MSIRRKFEEARDRAAELSKQESRTDEQEQELCDQLDRAEELKGKLDEVTARDERLAALQEVSRAVAIPGTSTTAEAKPADLTAGEFLASFYQAYHPEGDSAPAEFLDRAAQYFDRAQQTTADTGGIIPTPIIGEVIKLSDSRRPVFNALTSRPMPPKGKTFERPYITQRTTAGTQTEGQSLSSQKMTVTSDTVTKGTQGGTLDLTHQDIDWTEPSALQLLVQDFVDTYAEWTEGLACDFVEGLPVAAGAANTNDGTGYSTWTATNTSTIVGSYIDGFVAVYNTSKRMPNTVFLDLPGWALLAKTVSSNSDITALSLLRESLSELGIGGVRWVVGPQFAADTRIIAAGSLLESYEQQKGLLRAENPSTLSVTLAYAGYTAFYGKHEGVVQLGTDPEA